MDQLGRLGLERFGAGDQIGFVIGEEIEHGAQHGRIAQAGAQFLCAQPGQVEQAFGAARILLECGRVRLGRGIVHLEPRRIGVAGQLRRLGEPGMRVLGRLARQGDGAGLYSLGMLYARGADPVSQRPVPAWMLLTLAERASRAAPVREALLTEQHYPSSARAGLVRLKDKLHPSDIAEAERLAACGGPTCVQINSRYYENVTPSEVPKIVEHLKAQTDGDS